MNKPARVLVTPGEPAGIGPDIVVRLAQEQWPIECVVIADESLLLARAKELQLPLQLIKADIHEHPSLHPAGSLKIIPISLNAAVQTGTLNVANADYVIRTLTEAAQICLNKDAIGIVTGPVHKGIINQAGISFRGHTEFFAALAHVQQTVMLFVVEENNQHDDAHKKNKLINNLKNKLINNFKVALVTTHIPLHDVSKTITKPLLTSTIEIIHEGLQKYFLIDEPCILVCGLNPHAGEQGYLGREEIEIIHPVIEDMKKKNYFISGPYPADTIFSPKYLKQADVILAMYHDQALPIVKYIGFGSAVNMTLGLPFIRTSVDHGTALDIAGTDQVDVGSMRAALHLMIELSFKHSHRQPIDRN